MMIRVINAIVGEFYLVKISKKDSVKKWGRLKMAKVIRKGFVKKGDKKLNQDPLISPVKKYSNNSKHISRGLVDKSDPIYKNGWSIICIRRLK